MKNKYNFKLKFSVISLVFAIITIAFSICMIVFSSKESFGIAKAEWLDFLFAGIASIATVFLGVVAFLQNERFKYESDLSAQRSEEKSIEYQNQLIDINNRIMKLEENKEYAYLAFAQDIVVVCNSNCGFQSKNPKTYTGGITNGDKDFKDGTVFIFNITNQTDVPIRYFQIKKLNIRYSDYGTGEEQQLVTYTSGGFIPNPIISKGENVSYVLVANGLTNLAEDLPNGVEINLVIELEVVSIFGRRVIQTYLLRLQRKNAFFDAKTDKHIFWNYCYESTPKLLAEEHVGD